MNPASNYIIEGNLLEFYMSIGISWFVTLVFLAHYGRAHRDLPKGQKPKPTSLYWAAIFFIAPALVYQFDFKSWQKLKANAAETYGTTIRKGCPTKGSCYVEFVYEVNGQSFKTTCGYTYDGRKIKGIKFKGGRYVVIYNSEDPEFAVMDFKRPLSNSR